MKKLLLATLVIFMLAFTVKSQIVVNGCTVTLKEATSAQYLIYENDSIKVSFTPSDFFWKVKISNKSKREMSIVWDKSSFIVNGKSSKIIFDNTINLHKHNAVPNETISSDTYIEKSIFPVENLDTASPVVSKRFATQRFKETGNPDTVRIILATDVDGKTSNLAFNFNVTPKLKGK